MKKGILVVVLAAFFIGLSGIAFGGDPTSITQPLSQTYFPIKISTPGSYILNSNLKVSSPNTTAILVLADNVTIDLNGFAILGPTLCTGTPVTSCTPTGTGNGIDASGHNNVKVTNGTIRGMGQYGIIANDDCIIQGLRVISNGKVGITVGGGTVSGNTADGNGSDGIAVGAGTVQGNTALNNAGHGIAVGTGTVSSNTALNNGITGIFVNDSATVSGNTSNGNSLIGIFVNNSGTVSGNTAANNVDGLLLGTRTGYFDNGLADNAGSDVIGGVNLGHNLCDLALCP